MKQKELKVGDIVSNAEYGKGIIRKITEIEAEVDFKKFGWIVWVSLHGLEKIYEQELKIGDKVIVKNNNVFGELVVEAIRKDGWIETKLGGLIRIFVESKDIEKIYEYGCGHSPNCALYNTTTLSASAYFTWKEQVDSSDKSECFDCFCKRVKKEEDKPEQKPKTFKILDAELVDDELLTREL